MNTQAVNPAYKKPVMDLCPNCEADLKQWWEAKHDKPA